MNIQFGFRVLLFLLLFGCYRPTTRHLRLHLPEVEGNVSELNALKTYLLNEEDNLRDGLRFYESITIDTDESTLDIIYHRRHLADQNIISKIHRIGYTVNGVAGNPEILTRNRKTLNLR